MSIGKLSRHRSTALLIAYVQSWSGSTLTEVSRRCDLTNDFLVLSWTLRILLFGHHVALAIDVVMLLSSMLLFSSYQSL